MFDIVSRQWLAEAVDLDMPHITRASRRGLERTLELALLLDIYQPTLTLS